MKKVLFILAFMLMGSVTFADNSKIEDKEKTEVIEKKNSDYKETVKVVQNGIFCIEYHSVFINGVHISDWEVETHGVNGECGFTMHFVQL